MRFNIDETLHWTDHYVTHGFAVLRNLINPDWIDEAFKRVRNQLGTDLPPEQWSVQSLSTPPNGRITLADPTLVEYLDTVYDDPGLRNMIDTMFGSPDQWNEKRLTRVFVSAFNPDAEQTVDPVGHIDFPGRRAPILGSGFMFFVSLVKTDMFSGNLTLYPGTHKLIQKRMLDDPDWIFTDEESLAFLGKVEPYEFIAEPGDVVLFHHLVCHAGNQNAATTHRPRVCIHAQALRKIWPSSLDAAIANLSPWERSLTLNGPVNLDYDEEAVMTRR